MREREREERRRGSPLIVRRPLFPPEVGTSVFRPRIRIPFPANLLFRYLHYTLIPRAETRAKDPLHLGIRTGFSPTARLMRKVAFSPDEIPSARPNIAERRRKGERKKREKPTKGRPTRSRSPFRSARENLNLEMRRRKANATLREDNPRCGMIKKKGRRKERGNVCKGKSVSYMSKRKFQRDLLIRD